MECLEWILDHGGSIHDRDNLGGTPVHDAAEQGQVHVASILETACVVVSNGNACFNRRHSSSIVHMHGLWSRRLLSEKGGDMLYMAKKLSEPLLLLL